MTHRAALMLVATAALAAPAAPAAEYPTKSIRLIVPFAPGGGTDLLARLVAPKLGELLGQQVVADNRGGAGSVIGTQMIAKAEPDGYTLGFFDTAFTINPAIMPKLPYDTAKDFAILTIVGTSPTVLTVHSSVPAKSIKELIAYAKANPGKLKFGSAGTNSSGHLTGEMFNAAAGVDITHIPYKGAGAAILDLLGGHIDLTYAVPGSIAQYLQAGTLRALATTGSKRSPALPDVPTFESMGLGSVNPGNFRFLAGPAGLPQPVQKKLVAAMERISKMQDFTTRMVELGYDPAFIHPPASRDYVAAELGKWRKVMKESALKVK